MTVEQRFNCPNRCCTGKRRRPYDAHVWLLGRSTHGSLSGRDRRSWHHDVYQSLRHSRLLPLTPNDIGHSLKAYCHVLLQFCKQKRYGYGSDVNIHTLVSSNNNKGSVLIKWFTVTGLFVPLRYKFKYMCLFTCAVFKYSIQLLLDCEHSILYGSIGSIGVGGK